MAVRPPIAVRQLTIGYGERVVQRDLNFTVERGDIFIVMGGSGCGKSTLLRHLIGLNAPHSGEVYYHGHAFWQTSARRRNALMRRFGVLYQRGALWSALTLAENVAVPLQQHTRLNRTEIRDLAEYKLSLVGLERFADYYPAEISGGMQKRAGLARALALDPEVLFFDEPSAGLDPLSARRLDDLILHLRATLNATFVVVTHELESLFAIGSNGIFLDADSQTAIAHGAPRDLKSQCDLPKVRAFLSRGVLS